MSILLREENKKRVLFVACIIVFIFTVCSLRVIYLQVFIHEELLGEAKNYYLRKVPIYSKRGKILDRNGRLLADDFPVKSLYLDLKQIEDIYLLSRSLVPHLKSTSREIRNSFEKEKLMELYSKRLVKQLAEILKVEQKVIKEKLEKGKKSKRAYILIRRDIPEQEVRSLKKIFQKEKLGGLYFLHDRKRIYPLGRKLCHILGFVDSEHIGRNGIEKVYNNVLSGNDGYRLVDKDLRQKEIYRREEVLPKDGFDVKLTIDIQIQSIVENELQTVFELYKPESVTCILMRPATGEMLAMASLPNYNPNIKKGPPENRINRMTSSIFEPGSIFKTVSIASAFNKNIVKTDDIFFCHFGKLVDGKFFLHDEGEYGYLSVRKIIAKSSNIGTYKILQKLGKKNFYRSLKRFGFGEKTGIELPNESKGILHHPKTWRVLSLSRIGIGQGIAVTPLQMVHATASIANYGEMMKPHLVHSVLNKEKVVSRFFPNVLRRVMTHKSAKKTIDVMGSVVMADYGTGKKAQINGFKVAGKTGTAQKPHPTKKGYIQGFNILSFVGFVPKEKAELAGIIIIDSPRVPKEENYGGFLAAPLFGQIADKVLFYMGIERSKKPPIIIKENLVKNKEKVKKLKKIEKLKKKPKIMVY